MFLKGSTPFTSDTNSLHCKNFTTFSTHLGPEPQNWNQDYQTAVFSQILVMKTFLGMKMSDFPIVDAAKLPLPFWIGENG